jgi:hypothetical protein
MKSTLGDFQRRYAHHRITFVSDLLSLELAESLRRTSLACAENKKKQSGIIDVLCGLYLQNPSVIARSFKGDLASVVNQNFPIHRFGREGLLSKAMLDQVANDEDGAAYGYAINFSDDVLHVLWLSAKLANAVGKKASLQDVIATMALDRGWMDELSRSGITPNCSSADFDDEVGTIVFYATPHTGEGWPREIEFELDKEFQPPYRLEVSTPSGPFAPVRSARVKLNGSEVGNISWPARPIFSTEVELLLSNKIEFELDGPRFGSIEVSVRGTPVRR